MNSDSFLVIEEVVVIQLLVASAVAVLGLLVPPLIFDAAFHIRLDDLRRGRLYLRDGLLRGILV